MTSDQELVAKRDALLLGQLVAACRELVRVADKALVVGWSETAQEGLSATADVVHASLRIIADAETLEVLR